MNREEQLKEFNKNPVHSGLEDIPYEEETAELVSVTKSGVCKINKPKGYL